jgi:hypothetical protein
MKLSGGAKACSDITIKPTRSTGEDVLPNSILSVRGTAYFIAFVMFMMKLRALEVWEGVQEL